MLELLQAKSLPGLQHWCVCVAAEFCNLLSTSCSELDCCWCTLPPLSAMLWVVARPIPTPWQADDMQKRSKSTKMHSQWIYKQKQQNCHWTFKSYSHKHLLSSFKKQTMESWQSRSTKPLRHNLQVSFWQTMSTSPFGTSSGRQYSSGCYNIWASFRLH